MFTGFDDRLKQEMDALYGGESGCNFVGSSNRMYSSWIGGSMLASTLGFNDICVSKKDYEEEGPNVMNRSRKY